MYDEILKFWFVESSPRMWWTADPAFDSAIADLLAMIEPVLIAFLGVTIGSIVISMYLPLFTLI